MCVNAVASLCTSNPAVRVIKGGRLLYAARVLMCVWCSYMHAFDALVLLLQRLAMLLLWLIHSVQLVKT